MVLDNPTNYANFVTRFVVNLLIILTKVFLPILLQEGIIKEMFSWRTVLMRATKKIHTL